LVGLVIGSCITRQIRTVAAVVVVAVKSHPYQAMSGYHWYRLKIR